jgi:hypothetical protein
MPRIMHRMRCPPALPAVLFCGAIAACSPAQDWRELQPDGSGAALMFPCKPVSHARQVPLDGAPVMLTLHACTAGDEVTYALAVADVADPARVATALQALRDSAAGNVAAGAPAPLPLDVRGATPNPAAGRAAYAGTRSDGQPVQMQVAVFSKGTRVYQATVIGRQIGTDAADTFFGALRTP